MMTSFGRKESVVSVVMACTAPEVDFDVYHSMMKMNASRATITVDPSAVMNAYVGSEKSPTSQKIMTSWQ